MSFLEHLKTVFEDPQKLDEHHYSLNEVRSISDKLYPLDEYESTFLALKISPIVYEDDEPDTIEDCWLLFAVFQFASQVEGEEKRVSVLFHGMGPTGTLGELRHIWWGKKGYVFYQPIKATIKAFEILSTLYED